jgi:glycosyltransferase involved in cell wall biosynthesis
MASTTAADTPASPSRPGGERGAALKVLLLAYYFPPLNDTAALRYVSFCKYAKEHDVEPLVLTVTNPDMAYCSKGNEHGEAVKDVKVFRSRSVANVFWLTRHLDSVRHRIARVLRLQWKPNLFMQLCVPDIFAGWIPLTVWKAWRIVKRERPDVIMAGCKPMTSGLVGAILKKLTGLPLMIDLQDPWRFDVIYEFTKHEMADSKGPIWFMRWYSRVIETWMMKSVDRLVTTSEDCKRLYEHTYPFLRGRVTVVHIGFSDAFTQKPALPAAADQDRFTLVYTGNFYYYVDPSDAIFTVIKRLLDRGVITSQTFRFRFVGSYGPWLTRLVAKYGLQDIVETTGHVPQEQVRQHLDSATMLFIRLFRPCVNLSTKVFEAMAVGTPVLANIDDGEQARVIRAYSKRYEIVDADDDAGLESALEGLYAEWKAGTLRPTTDAKYVNHFNARAITGRLAGIARDCLPAQRQQSVCEDGTKNSRPILIAD